MHEAQYSHLSDESIIDLARTDQNVFGELIRRYQHKLLRYIHSITRCSDEDAEDLLQEAFLKAYRNMNGFDASQKFSSWIYRIVHNEVISAHRKRSARAESRTEYATDEALDRIASECNIPMELEQQETRTIVRNVLNSLDAKYREVLILQFLEEREYKEISYILQKPMGTIATLINRAKKQFLDRLKNHPAATSYVRT